MRAAEELSSVEKYFLDNLEVKQKELESSKKRRDPSG